MSLARVLELLPTLHSGAEVIGALGEPTNREKFGHDDPTSEYLPNRYPVAVWKQLTITTPKDLLDAMPVGTTLLLYEFGFGSRLNPTADQLFVCIDNSDRLIGWMYGKALLGHEDESVFMDT